MITSTQPETHFAHVRGIRLHFSDWGDNGPPLLLLHGDMRTSRSWDAVARDLRSRFHVISLDARGHGNSDWTPRGYTIQERVEDLAAFCQRIGLREAIGVGHSTGAAVIAFCAKQSPGVFSRLVLMEPLVVLDETFQRRVAPRAAQPRRTWTSRQELYQYLKSHTMTHRWREDVIRDVVDHEAVELPDGSIDMKWASATFNRDDRHGDHYDLRPLFRSLGLPVLFMASEERQSGFDVLRPITAEVPDFHVVVVRRTGHNMYMERPDAVSGAIVAFARGQALPAQI